MHAWVVEIETDGIWRIAYMHDNCTEEDAAVSLKWFKDNSDSAANEYRIRKYTPQEK